MKVKLKNVISDFLVPMRDKPKLFDGNIPWCRIEDIKGKYLSDTLSNQYVSKNTVKSMNLKVYPINTLLFTCSATIGVTALTKKPLCTNQTFIGLVGSDEIEIEFLYYYLGLIGKDLTKAASVTTIPYLSKRFFENLEIELPSLRNQKQIAKVLSDLDAKIEVNNKINQELEAMAKTLYDYWFVQFDFPDANGNPYKSSGGKMVYNEALKREIPEGWEVKEINKVIEVKDGTHDSPKSIDKGYKLITSKHLKLEGLDFESANSISQEDYININKRSQVDTGDILFSMIGNIGTVYKVEEKTIDFAIKNVALYKTSEFQNLKNYIYMYLRGYDMQRYMCNVIAGSIQKFIGLGSLRKMPLLMDEKTISNFEVKTKAIFNQINTLKLENQKLSELRDWLLPMLMNGQVTVKN